MSDSRYLTTSAGQPHPLDAELPSIEGEHAGIPGGATEAVLAAEEARCADLPEIASTPTPDAQYANPALFDAAVHEHFEGLNAKEPPRHDAYADENTSTPTPERVIPGGPTNAHPDFAIDQFGNAEPNVGITTTAHLSTTGRGAFEEGWDQVSEEDKAKEAAVADEAAAGPDSDQAGAPVEELVPTGAAAEATQEAVEHEHDEAGDTETVEEIADPAAADPAPDVPSITETAPAGLPTEPGTGETATP